MHELVQLEWVAVYVLAVLVSHREVVRPCLWYFQAGDLELVTYLPCTSGSLTCEMGIMYNV